MTREEKIAIITEVLDLDSENIGKIAEKSDAQLDYVLAPIDKCVYLEACAGSGKTEVLGIKAAYEIQKWESCKSGIAVLSFTNEATMTITDRIMRFHHNTIPANHFVGTFSSFIQGYITQRFGYNIYGSPEDGKDMSFRIISLDINQYNNRWLENYKVCMPFYPAMKSVYAHQIIYKVSAGDWIIGEGEMAYSLKERYESDDFQNKLDKYRKDKQLPWLYEFDYICSKIAECKKKLWKDRFASFEDMNYIARKCLENKKICNIIARRYPVIMIDECQDLSTMELSILSQLISAGTTVHYIGDLHQAIYSFKDAIPDSFMKHLNSHGFITMSLEENYRSTQAIVEISKKLGNIERPLRGMACSICEGSDCLYLEYDNDESEAVTRFKEILCVHSISIEKSIVLVRSHSLRERLCGEQRINLKTHPIINAIQLWLLSNPDNRKQALELLALQLQKWIGYQGIINNYYYSEEICPNCITWRLFLHDILEDLCSNTEICNLNVSNYGNWYSKNKENIKSIINKHLKTLGITIDPTIRTPYGTKDKTIEQICKHDGEIRIETIHSAKGSTYDAVLVLSTKNANGRTGYWQKWLESEDETGRIGYVASTRPRFLLCWGVSRLTEEQRSQIEELGFVKDEPS